MSRADSAGVYGSGTPLNLARLNRVAPPASHGLRSESAPNGWYSAGTRPSTPRKPKPYRNGPVTSNRPSASVSREQARADRLAREWDDYTRGHDARVKAGIIGDVD